MVLKYEGKRLREIRSHKRKSLTKSGRPVYVKSYYQRYDKPRGAISPLKVDTLTSHSKTAWLKDREGHFVGRANSRGRTKAKRVAMAAEDVTTNYRERGRYGRIYGRAGIGSRRRQ